MRARTWPILVKAVEDGVAFGWERAHKNQANPSAEVIKGDIVSEVLDAIAEWFDFDSYEIDKFELEFEDEYGDGYEDEYRDEYDN